MSLLRAKRAWVITHVACLDIQRNGSLWDNVADFEAIIRDEEGKVLAAAAGSSKHKSILRFMKYKGWRWVYVWQSLMASNVYKLGSISHPYITRGLHHTQARRYPKIEAPAAPPSSSSGPALRELSCPANLGLCLVILGQMDLETENRIAAMLMREAAELRCQAEKEGVHAYLQPKVRGRPNSRFLAATVRGVQQANRAVEVSEMWRVRQKELELDNKRQGRSRDENSSRRHSDHSPSTRSTRHRETDDDLCTSSKRTIEECHSNGDGSGLRDEEVEEFLHSRVKRGRGAIGSRMDETGPYLPPLHSEDSKEKLLAISNDVRVKEDWEHRVLLGPEKPTSLKKSSWKSSSENNSDQEGSWKKVKKVESVSSSKKQHSKKHKSKDKSRDKKKAKKSKHRHRSRSR
ncbi:hypothetical protein BVC80_1767g16 [Macleaya cordata]|uniref:Uncharacterized protein n=1 Tax=Macleaya cordata TaxID=56857 RepID=A0A200QTA3_MACCD|nr:hypothetical protein BVC80_1767g16 [Macleaya cordata]